MNELTRQALLGTGKSGPTPESESGPVDDLCNSIPAAPLSTESALLLKLGATAVYEAAGIEPNTVPAIEPDHDDSACPWSDAASELLEQAFSKDFVDVAPELCRKILDANHVLPRAILPVALDTKSPELRSKITRCLGCRGRWLAALNPEWNWAISSETSVNENSSLPELKRQWDEGTIAERRAVLRKIREIDPTQGREWLEETFSSDKANDRNNLLQDLEENLNADDEPFLIQCLKDRSKYVRTTAIELLATLPESEVVERMKIRSADFLLKTSSPNEDFKLKCVPPETYPSEWETDGIPENPTSRKGQKSHWLDWIISRVPPRTWTDRFDCTPEQLLNGILNDDWGPVVILGWTRAIRRFGLAEEDVVLWGRPMWTYWMAMLQHNVSQVRELAGATLSDLLGMFPEEMRESALMKSLREVHEPTILPISDLLTPLKTPWSRGFADAFLSLARNLLRNRNDQKVVHWMACLKMAGAGIPRESFPEAMKPWNTHSGQRNFWDSAAIDKLIQELHERVKLRERFYRELDKMTAAE
ncbi:hypothetical protein KOR42_35420 [Thalassoglobus neptunius]|uniref:Uncharacterized protein n=1 Tax=Thalassoglobus neptunius TaxID=1938619 RepID=A0A5C5WL34_9PLAN|nr:DUF5691 domain-containing protein [Thalassoglobus neptunius]TWT51494.1 hypothetical protein KOR42_35420 [Thalassoglobus neptunius]